MKYLRYVSRRSCGLSGSRLRAWGGFLYLALLKQVDAVRIYEGVISFCIGPGDSIIASISLPKRLRNS